MTAGLSLVPLGRRWFVLWVRGGRPSCRKIQLVPKYLLRLMRAPHPVKIARPAGSTRRNRFRPRPARSGVDTLRTMLARDDDLNMAFFRSQGMMGGPFVQLEMPLDPRRDRAGG